MEEVKSRDGTLVGLRRATPEDADIVYRWRCDPVARRFQALRNRSPMEIRQKLAERAVLTIDPDLAGEVQWIVLASTEPVGWITLNVHSREHGVGELGYTIATEFHRRGYASAAVRLVLPIAFSSGDSANLWRLEASAAVDNVASRTVLERAGFQLEGTARQSAIIGGVRVDHAKYALLRPDWEAQEPPSRT